MDPAQRRVNAEFSPTSSQDPPANVSYTVTNAPKGGQVKVTVKFTSTAGVGEKTLDAADRRVGGDQPNQRHLLAAHGKRRIRVRSGRQRDLPALHARDLQPPEGSYKLASGLYTFTASGKSVGTPLCSQKGSGQFAVHKENSFDVFSQGFKEEPPYEYNFGVSSDNSSGLPTIVVTYTGCSGSASSLEGETYEYPAAMSVFTTEPELSADGLVYAGSTAQEGPNYKVTTNWNFTAGK